MAKAKKKKNIFKNFNRLFLPAALTIILLILTVLTYEMIMADKYYPQTLIGDTNISFLTQGQAIRRLQSTFNHRANQKLPFGDFFIDLATSSAQLNYSSLDEAFKIGRTGSFKKRAQDQLSSLFGKNLVLPPLSLSLDKQIDKIAEAIYQSPQNAQLIFNDTTTPEGSPSASIQIKKDQAGVELDKALLKKKIADYLLFGQYQNQLPLKVIPPKVTTDHVQRAKQALDESQIKPIKLKFQSSEWVIDTKQLLTILDLTSGQNLLLDNSKTYLYLQKIAKDIDTNVQEGLFEFNPQTLRVTAFQASQEGRKLDQDRTYQLITDALINKSAKEIDLPVSIVKPKIQTADVNSLGIKELIGRGVSNFAGSIPNRIYNVNLTAAKINGILVPPEEIFSFNKTVGDITAATGFKQAYVIKEGRTVLDDGGGVCQDSTTLFRAVLNAGLPVIARTAHAYRVGYYEQGFPPGLDATVFYPSVDFQFKNDTGHHILIQAYTVGITLYVDLYGTSDGRKANISRSVVTNQTPPPPDLKQDDPTLPKGVVKQVDFSAWGANVSFNRTVTRGNETLIKETWKSFFKPWQAIYLVGTQ